jgi:methionyl-tRNA synthetase
VTSRFYITTAIDYSNGVPHIGHAYEKLGADCVARYRRLRGDRVHFAIGMDEHGQNVAQAAEAAGKEPQDWVDEIAAQFQTAWRELSISHTDFIRTTEPRHRLAVEELFRRIQQGGFISEGVYTGFYCVGCEAFKSERDLEDGRCPVHPTREIKQLEEPNYFFDLGHFRRRLLEHYDSHPDFVRPEAKLNEIRNVVADWTDDQKLSVSRARVPWGIPWPEDPDHTVYVWFDALINYLSSTGFPNEGYTGIWPADVHVIGPDIVRFHAAIWPAMLLAAGIELPRQVWCHGWVLTEGARFSKSAGVGGVELRDAIDRHGPDALRYFLLREVPWHSDGAFTWERFDARYTAELADGYGNLLSRVLAMIGRYVDGVVPEAGEVTSLDRVGEEAIGAYREAMDQHMLHDGAAAAWQLVSRANGFVEQSAPWQLAKEGKRSELDPTLASLARSLARITMMAMPFIPNKGQIALEALGLSGDLRTTIWEFLERPPVGGARVAKPPPLFPKVDKQSA